MKKAIRITLKLIAVLVMLVLVVACSNSSNETVDNGSSNDEKTYELIFSNVTAPSHPTNVVAEEWMAKELEERTNGRVTLTVHPGGALGGDNELVEGMRTGDVDIAWISTGSLARYVKSLNTLSISYLINDREHFREVAAMGSPVMNEIARLVEKAEIGSRVVGMMGGSPRRLYNQVREVHTPKDLEGLTIRVQDSPIEAKVWSELGASVVPVAWNELYTALQTNVVDGAESSTASYLTEQFYKVAGYHSLTDHQFLFLPVLMSNKTYEELPEDLRAIVLEVMEESSEKNWEKYWADEDETIQKLKDEGVVVNEVDIAAFQEIIEPLHDEIAADLGGENLLKLIREAGE